MSPYLHFTERFFQASGNSVRKWKLYKMKVVIQNSAIKGCHEFDVRSQKGLEMPTLATPTLSLTRVIL